jgi:Tol biopolymer transport system component
VPTEFNESDGHFSPDMRWIAYVSDESGINEIYVQAFSRDSGAASMPAGGKWRVSQGGGKGPRWRRDGKELYYSAPDRTVMAVEISADTTFRTGIRKPLFQAPLDIENPASIVKALSFDPDPLGDPRKGVPPEKLVTINLG